MVTAADWGTVLKHCIIDALNECDRESMDTLLQQFRNISSDVRILLTNRPYSEIREHPSGFANKDLASRPKTKEDVDRCIERKHLGHVGVLSGHLAVARCLPVPVAAIVIVAVKLTADTANQHPIGPEESSR